MRTVLFLVVAIGMSSAYLRSATLPVPGNYINQNPGEFNNTTENYNGRWIFIVLNLTSTNLSAQIYNPSRAPTTDVAVKNFSLADTSVTPETKTMTLAQLKSAKTLSIPLIVHATPNPKVTNGYQVQLQLLTQRINLNVFSPYFLQFQAVPLSNTTTLPLPVDITYQGNEVDKWLVTATTGGFISQTFNVNQIIQIANTFGTKTTTSVSFNFSVNYDNVINAEQGTYFFSIFTYMSPYEAPTSFSTQLSMLDNQVDPAVGSYQSLVGTINGNLSVPSQFTADEIANLVANKKLTQTLGSALVSASITQYKALLPLATTPSEVAVVASRVAVLTAIDASYFKS